MPLFGRRRDASTEEVPAAGSRFVGDGPAHGLEPATGTVLDQHVQDAVNESARVLYGATPRKLKETNFRTETAFHDAFRGNRDGRSVVVANGWTNIKPAVFGSAYDMEGVAVCVVELPTMLRIACVQPRGFRPVTTMRENPTGSPAFDERFSVHAPSGSTAQVLTPDVQRLIMARDDWIFRVDRYLLSCVSKGPFGSVDEMVRRIDEVLAIVTAIPTSVMPTSVDHSEDDLIARIGRLESVEDALAMLQELTPDDRERLAKSDTPLAAFADVVTPEQAIERFQGLDPQKRMQLLAMFVRVEDGRKGG